MGRKANILVAEDDEAMREFLVQALRRCGHAVTAAGDGGEALELMALSDCDLLLADVHMPGVDGISLVRCARNDHPDLPVLFVTGFAGEAQAEQRRHGRHVQVLPKPFRLNQLVDTVGRMLAA